MKSIDEIEELSNKELIKEVVLNWNDMSAYAKVLAYRLEDAIKENKVLLEEIAKGEVNGGNTGRKG